MTRGRRGALVAMVVAALPVSAEAQPRAPCPTACSFELRLRGDGCCPARAAPRRVTPPCGALDHADGGHCCGMGESWSAATSRCACVAPGGCGPERCAAEEVRRTCETSAPTARPRYEAPPWVLERRPTRHPSRAVLLQEIRLAAELGGSALGPPGTGLSPAARAQYLARLIEDFAELVTLAEEEARALEALPPAGQGEARPRREALLRDAQQYREQIVHAARSVIDTAPTAPGMDAVLFRLAGALAGLSRHDEARRVYRSLLQRYPQSPYVPHAYLAFAEHFFAERAWEPAAQFYERARLPAEPANRVRAYALYRLAWTRLLLGAPAAATALFDEAIAWARAHPDAPDVAQLAEAARAEREAAAWVAAPTRVVAGAFDAGAAAQAAAVLDGAGDWRGALALYRRLLAQRSLDAGYCAWRAAAEHAMVCIARARTTPH